MSKRNKPSQDDPAKSDRPAVQVNMNLSRITKTIFFSCLSIFFLLMFLDYHVNYAYWTEIGALRRLCNITREDGLASYVGVTITGLPALTLWVTYVIERRLDSKKMARVGWLILALFFSYMAMDDGSSFHERMGSTFGAIQDREINSIEGPTSFAARSLDKFPSYSWQVVYMPIFGVLGAFTFIFLMFQLKTMRRRIAVICAFGLMASAIGLDFIEGLDPEHPLNLYTTITDQYKMNVFTITHFREMAYDAVQHFSKSIEEVMEMLAMTILWITFIGHIGSRTSEINVSLNK